MMLKTKKTVVLTYMLLLVSAEAFAMGMSFGGDKNPVEETTPVLQIKVGPLSSPVGLTPVYTRRGLDSLLVTDAAKRTVNKVDPITGHVEELFSTGGLPLGVAKYRRFIYVGNRTDGTVDIYYHGRKRDRLIRKISTADPMQPNDIAIDYKKRRLFVVDGLANDVKVFTLSGRLVRTIDGFGDIFDPKGVAIDSSTRDIAITDAGDPDTGMPASVQVYDKTGSQLLYVTGAFSAPQGVAFGVDRLFVADALLGQVLVFNRTNGALLGSFGSFGTDPGQLMFPLDLVYAEKQDALHVVNNRMGRVETYVSDDFKPVEVSQ